MFEIMLSGTKSKAGGEEFVGPPGKGDFIGEVTAASFITGDALATEIGLSAGTSQHSDAGWLKFEDSADGKTKYVSKRPLRHSISWDALHAKGAVFGTATVVIQDSTYKVRLLSGANSNPAKGPSGWDAPYTHGCEWNRLMYHISAKPFKDNRNTLASEGISEGDWASYSEADLVTHSSGGNGNRSWCQETGTTPTTRVNRGFLGVSVLLQDTSSGENAVYGWRACLELVE